MKKRAQIRGAILWVVLFLLMIIMVIPIVWTVMNAFKSNIDIMNHPFSLPTKLDFSNFAGAWKLGRFDIYIINTLLMVAGTVLLTLATCCPTAYALAKIKFKHSDALFYTLFLGLSIPSQAIVLSVFYRMKSLGVINSLWGLTLTLVGLSMPFSVFLMRNTFRDLPAELRESALIDGAGEWRIFISVYMPLAKAGILALIVFTFINTWNEYLYPLVLLISQDKQVIATAVAAFKSEANTNYGFIFAAAVYSLIPSVIIYLMFQRSFTSGITSGATKG